MSSFSTPAILLRRVDYGDYDLIITFFTRDYGKLSTIAKSAKKSVKRFAGTLELFSEVDIVCTPRKKGKGLPVLQEASFRQPFTGIREDILKTAYASYWAELMAEWLESDQKQTRLFELLSHVYTELDLNEIPPEVLSMLFQMQFLLISGHRPNLSQCGKCLKKTTIIEEDRICFDLRQGGLICGSCQAKGVTSGQHLSRGTIKQLLWMESGDLKKAGRIRLSQQSIKEGQAFLEAFVPFHLGKQPKSLGFLKQIR
ncbi:MAG: DNA repair protein RecO [Desulfobacterales bacterium]|nr:DNA repair protein RecO [Desulfobacterales bacterium]